MSAPIPRVESRLSVPPRISHLEPGLTELERTTLHRVADTLIPATDVDPRPTSLDDYDSWLDRAAAARGEHADVLRGTLAAVASVPDAGLWDALRSLDGEDPAGFQVLSAVVAGAYLMHPAVRAIIGYPGQVRNPPRFDEAAEELADGILDPVIDRGSIYVRVPGE